MKNCDNCLLQFPDDLINPLNVNGTYSNVCAICALKIINEAHGINRKSFTAGSIAQKKLEQAQAFLAKNKGSAN